MKHILMKCIVLLPLLSLFAIHVADAQSTYSVQLLNEKARLLCIYRLNYLPDSTATFRANEYMRLLVGMNTSKFESKGTFLHDSLSAAMPETPGSTSNLQEYSTKLMSLPHSRQRYRVFKNLSNNTIQHYEEISGVLYKFNEPVPLQIWKISAEKATLAGYACQKATTSFAGRNYEAWFTRDVAVADGPYKFHGLPGLIVKLNDTRNHYIFELVRLNRLLTVTPVALPNRKAVSTNKNALRKAQENYKANLPNIIAAGTPLKSDADKQDVRTRAKRMNNAIELR